MKTKMTMFAMLFLMFISPIGLNAGAPKLENGIAFLIGPMTAQTALSPAATADVMISVGTNFADISGFENAQLSVEVINNGAVLMVSLTGVSSSELPANTVLAEIKVVDDNGQRNFLVVTDGGTNVGLEVDL
jgi:hypothetical protein